jgi:hypothetical protein|tara:strand:+ start:245 stop:490 length:246 start_codon:yes stop_codon:yes gene_type:complete
MITKKEYLEAKRITDQYEEQLNITPVMWRCNRKLRMSDKEICFTNGKLYEQTKEKPLSLEDNQGHKHELGEKWEKWFIIAT